MLGGCLFQFSGREFPSGSASILVELCARGFVGEVGPAWVEDVTGTWIGAEVGDPSRIGPQICCHSFRSVSYCFPVCGV